MAGGRLPVRATAEGLLIAVRLTPKSGMDRITGIEKGVDSEVVLRARVRAVPEKGKANASLAALVASWLDVPKTACELAAGGKSRQKQVLVRGRPDELMARLTERLALLEAGE